MLDCHSYLGGIKSTNALRTLYGSMSRTYHSLDGIAVVSDIVASLNPREAANKLSDIFRAFNQSRSVEHHLQCTCPPSRNDILDGVVNLMNNIRGLNPLVHHVCYVHMTHRPLTHPSVLIQITNTVVTTQSANVTLALGASPIMTTEPQEMEDISRISDALLVNIGTMRSDTKESMVKAGNT